MRLAERRQQLDAALLLFRELWQPQPFREARPAWCAAWPALAAELLALSEAEAARLNAGDAAALALLARHLPAVAEIGHLAELPVIQGKAPPAQGERWAWEIPGRKRQQIEAFAAAAAHGDQPVLDWCGGKGHLGRLLALAWRAKVRTLDIDPVLCAAGEGLAQRAGVRQEFAVADALTVADWPRAGQHAVALHACGHLHRRLIREGAERGVSRFDVAPCCYYLGVGERYQPLSQHQQLVLTRDDTRLAVTETVTAAPREARQRDREMAWKLGFDAYRRAVCGDSYRSFKSIPGVWLRAAFAEFLALMAGREGLPPPTAGQCREFEAIGWQRRHDVMRLSIVRHAFRRAVEVWLALDLATYLEERGYRVALGVFCARQLTPRNLLISARLA